MLNLGMIIISYHLSLQIDNKIPGLSTTNVVRGGKMILEFRPTVPVLCDSYSTSCSLQLNLRVPHRYQFIETCQVEDNKVPFTDHACGVKIMGHIDGTNFTDYLKTPNNLTVYGKVTYQMGSITSRTLIAMLHFPPKANFREHPVWNNFSINTTVCN